MAEELDILQDTTAAEDAFADSTMQAEQSTILEDFYSQIGQTRTGPRGREVFVTEDMLRDQLSGELIAAQNYDYVPYGSIDPDDYKKDKYGNVIVREDEVFGPQAASGDALGFLFSNKKLANKLFGDQADQVESTIRDYNSQIYAITSGAAELGLTLPEEDQQRLRQQAQEMYPDASEAELQYVYKQLVKDEIGIDDFLAEKVRLSEERDSVLAGYGLDVATMGERAGPQQTLAGTYEITQGETTYTIDASTGEIAKYTKPITGVIAKAIFTTAVSAGLTGPLAGALQGAGLSSAAATAASQAIVSTAAQYMTTGEIDWKQALVSAATAYGGVKLGDTLKGSGALGKLGEIGDKVTGVTDKFTDFVTQGNSIAEAAIKAGGMSMLTQFVTTGEVDVEQAALAALMAGGAQGFSEWQASMTDAGQPVSDEYMQDLAENEEFTQAAIDADIKDPFLNPNYKTVGDGVVVNTTTGIVYGVTSGDELGNMSDLDGDGDGMLSGDDLQNITTPNRELVDPTIRPDNNFGYELDDTVYVDAKGNPVDPGMVKFGPDGYTYNGEPVTTATYDQVFGGDKGGLKWEFGLNEDGSVSKTDGAIYYENGDLAYEKVSGQWQDSQGNIIDDPTKVDELTMIAAKAIDEPLESVQYFDQRGNLINYEYPPYDLRDNFEQGQFSGLIFGPDGETYEVWYDPITNTEYVKAPGTTEITAIRTPENPPEPVDPSTTDDNQGADQTNQESTSAGQGSGPTQATGGQAGTSGASGGATGGASIGGQAGTSGIGSGGGFIPSAGAGTDTTGTQTTGDSTAQGTGVSATNTAGTGGGPAGTNAGTGQNGQTGASSGTATGTGDAGANTGADTGTGQSIDIGFGVSFGEDSGTGGVTGGGAGEVAGGGTGDSPGTGTGSGGAGLGTGSSGGAISGMGKPASFQGMMAGLSYEPQPIPGIISTPQTDYAADLEELIARQLSKRGMFT